MAIRVAIIGLGAVTRHLHLPAYAQLKDQVRVVAGCDPDRTARAVVGKKWRVPELYENPRDMLDNTQPDVVSICTPPFLHEEHALLALEHGCHVFCEKPLVEHLSQADALIQAAQASGRFLVVNSQYPCMNIHRSAKALIGSPQFGRLLFLHAWQTFHPTAHTEAGWRGRMQRRVCFEFGVHVFELIRFFFDATPTTVFAHMPHPCPERSSEAVNIIALEFADGRAASIVLDRLSQGPERYLAMRLDGEFASIQTSIGGEVRFELGVLTRVRRPFLGLHVVKGGKAVLQRGFRSKVLAKDGINPFASATAMHFRNFIDALQNGDEPPVTARDHRNTLALVCAAYESAEAGKAVDMAPYLRCNQEG